MADAGLIYLSIVDEFEVGKGADCPRNFLQESFALDVAGGAKTGGDGIERSVVIAGVADELPCAVGHCLKDFMKRLGVELAGGGDADGAVGGRDVTVTELR